jgi:hypothetical protein
MRKQVRAGSHRVEPLGKPARPARGAGRWRYHAASTLSRSRVNGSACKLSPIRHGVKTLSVLRLTVLPLSGEAGPASSAGWRWACARNAAELRYVELERYVIALKGRDVCCECRPELPSGFWAAWEPYARTVVCLDCAGPEVVVNLHSPPAGPGPGRRRDRG